MRDHCRRARPLETAPIQASVADALIENMRGTATRMQAVSAVNGGASNVQVRVGLPRLSALVSPNPPRERRKHEPHSISCGHVPQGCPMRAPRGVPGGATGRPPEQQSSLPI